MSGHISTAGHEPDPAGWKSAASADPSGVGTITSVSVTLAAKAAVGEKGVVDPNGQQFVTGFTRGGTFKKIPSTEVGGAFKKAVQEAPEAIEHQRIPKAASDMAKGYFQNLGGQKSTEPKQEKKP